MASVEWKRLHRSVTLSWNCFPLHLQLRAGLKPWVELAHRSELANNVSFDWTMQWQELQRALATTEGPSLLQERGGQTG